MLFNFLLFFLPILLFFFSVFSILLEKIFHCSQYLQFCVYSYRISGTTLHNIHICSRLPSLSFMYSGFSSGMYRAVLRPGVQLMCADGVHGSGIDLQVNLGLGKPKMRKINISILCIALGGYHNKYPPPVCV